MRNKLLLTNRNFWCSYYDWFLQDEAKKLFGLEDPPGEYDLYLELRSFRSSLYGMPPKNTRRKRIEIPFPENHLFSIVFHPNPGITYELKPASLKRSFIIGIIDPGTWDGLPLFRWEEIMNVLEFTQNQTHSPISAQIIQLLLFPTIGFDNNDNMDDIKIQFCKAWDECGFPGESERIEIAERMIEMQKIREQWQNHPQMHWVTNNENSIRNPESSFSKRCKYLDTFQSFISAINDE